jgi:hypothetical protein
MQQTVKAEQEQQIQPDQQEANLGLGAQTHLGIQHRARCGFDIRREIDVNSGAYRHGTHDADDNGRQKREAR